MLGRFVVPASRLDEFEGAAAARLPKVRDADPWPIALLGGDPVHDAELIFAFNERHAKTAVGRAVIDTLEVKAATMDELELRVRSAPPGVAVYVEIPLAQDPTDLLSAIGNLGARAKMRTGGISPEAFPATRDVARFIRTAVDLGVPFKATAGLHHPLRGTYPLTYEPDAESGPMYGYLNVFLAALLATEGLQLDEIGRLLEEDVLERIEFREDGIGWAGHFAATADIERMRTRVAVSFGSCSFTEPAEDLAAMGLAP
jgi:hypothetical protein